jgi:hypothetical protein
LIKKVLKISSVSPEVQFDRLLESLSQQMGVEMKKSWPLGCAILLASCSFQNVSSQEAPDTNVQKAAPSGLQQSPTLTLTDGFQTEVLVARKNYRPSTWVDGKRNFSRNAEFRVPRELKVTFGNSGNHMSYLFFKKEGDSTDSRCDYKGGSSQSTPRGAELAKATVYKFVKCTSNLLPGQIGLAKELRLRLDNGGNYNNTTDNTHTQIQLAVDYRIPYVAKGIIDLSTASTDAEALLDLGANQDVQTTEEALPEKFLYVQSIGLAGAVYELPGLKEQLVPERVDIPAESPLATGGVEVWKLTLPFHIQIGAIGKVKAKLGENNSAEIWSSSKDVRIAAGDRLVRISQFSTIAAAPQLPTTRACAQGVVGVKVTPQYSAVNQRVDFLSGALKGQTLTRILDEYCDYLTDAELSFENFSIPFGDYSFTNLVNRIYYHRSGLLMEGMGNPTRQQLRVGVLQYRELLSEISPEQSQRCFANATLGQTTITMREFYAPLHPQTYCANSGNPGLCVFLANQYNTDNASNFGWSDWFALNEYKLPFEKAEIPCTEVQQEIQQLEETFQALSP